jgi:hypothetical protein
MHKKITSGASTTFTRVLEQMFINQRHPDLATHINTVGPTEWENTGEKLINKNHMLGLAFTSIAAYLAKLENSLEDWHLAPIRGHTRVHKLFPFYPANLATLEIHGAITVS